MEQPDACSVLHSKPMYAIPHRAGGVSERGKAELDQGFDEGWKEGFASAVSKRKVGCLAVCDGEARRGDTRSLALGRRPTLHYPILDDDLIGHVGLAGRSSVIVVGAILRVGVVGLGAAEGARCDDGASQ